MNRRAIVFDLDETLYRERRFALGGYRAVAGLVSETFDLPQADVFNLLTLALRQGRRGRAFQELAERFGLPASSIPVWVSAYRSHQPDLRLKAATIRTLEALRGRWLTGVLTNGLPAVQASKVKALGIDRLVDVVVYADRFGGGKPSPESFLEALARLGADASSSVFAGDDPVRDIEGARAVGMWTVLLRRGSRNDRDATPPTADAVVRSVAEVPEAAERLVRMGCRYVH